MFYMFLSGRTRINTLIKCTVEQILMPRTNNYVSEISLSIALGVRLPLGFPKANESETHKKILLLLMMLMMN